jgi:hypothetical protein
MVKGHLAERLFIRQERTPFRHRAIFILIIRLPLQTHRSWFPEATTIRVANVEDEEVVEKRRGD